MFSAEEKRAIAAKIESILLALDHPEMPVARPRFTLHVDGAESWSWADIEPNWKFEKEGPTIGVWNEVARDALKGKK